MPTSGGVIRSTGVIAGLTLGSRVLGLVREVAFSYFFSTSGLLSGFRIAFMLPNLARRLFGEGALSAAMIPVLTQSLAEQGEEPSRRFLGLLLRWLGVVLVGIAIVGEAGLVLACYFSADPALRLSAVLLPYMVLICAVAVIGGVLNVRGRFAVPAATPVLLNAVIITAIGIGALWFRLDEERLMYVVCGSVLVGGLAQLGAVVWALKRASFLPIFVRGARDPQLGRCLRLMGPMALGLSALQINSLMDYLIAYFFITVEGERVGPAVLGYAQVLYQLPLGVFGIALATAIFPVLSARAAEQDRAGLAAVLARGIRLSVFIALPASVGLMFVSHPLVATLFEHGRFDSGDTQRVAGTLVFYAAGLTAYFTQHLLARTFYAQQDSRTPATVTAYTVALNFALNLILVFPLQERGLALSTALTATMQVVLLWAYLGRTLPRFARQVAAALGRTCVSTATMGIALALAVFVLSDAAWAGSTPPAKLVVLIVVGVLTYAAVAWWVDSDTVALIRSSFRARRMAVTPGGEGRRG